MGRDDYRGAGGDENLSINFNWPKVLSTASLKSLWNTIVYSPLDKLILDYVQIVRSDPNYILLHLTKIKHMNVSIVESMMMNVQKYTKIF